MAICWNCGFDGNPADHPEPRKNSNDCPFFVTEEEIIHAGELRDCGVSIPPHIPDQAWIRRAYIVLDEGNVSVDSLEKGKLRATIPFRLSDNFRWVEIQIVNGKEEETLVSQHKREMELEEQNGRPPADA